MRPSALRGASCVARQRVYSRALRRTVLRCKTFRGGRVGLKKPPRRAPYGPRCVARQRVYSRALKKYVLRCAKMRWPDRSGFTVSYTTPPAVAQTVAQTTASVSPETPKWAVLVRPIRFVGVPRGYKNITKSPRGRERVASAIEQLLRGAQLSPETTQFLKNEQRRMRG